MPLTKSELFRYVHANARHANLAYFGGYQKAFTHYLKIAYEQKLVKGWAV